MVPWQQRQETILTLHPDRQPGGQTMCLPLLTDTVQVSDGREVEQLGQFIDLGWGQPYLPIIEPLSQPIRMQYKGRVNQSEHRISRGQPIRMKYSAELTNQHSPVIELGQDGGWVTPLDLGDLSMVQHGHWHTVHTGMVEHGVKPPVALLSQVSGCQPV